MKMVEEQGVVRRMLSDAEIPRMALVRQNFPRPRVENIPEKIRELLERPPYLDTIRPGMEVAITCGSRGIANIPCIIREICSFVRRHGAKPFIVPAMGSHGGATAEGQREILAGLGVTEETCGAEIRSDMNTVSIGQTEDGRTVYMNRHAAGADGIIVVGRIKPHTDFRGPYESGIMKMMVIGLGKQRGAEIFHQDGPRYMAQNIPLFGKAVLAHANILFALAILENAYDETARLEAILPHEIESREPPLLEEAKRLMPQSYIQDVDLLVVDQVGKDISGDGMDPNITGRFCNPYVSGGMHATKMAILDLSEASHGQMVGLGYGDTTTLRCFRKCDLEASYPNALTSTSFIPFRIPLILPSDREAIGACMKYLGERADRPRVIRIHDTLHLSEIWISEGLLEEAAAHPNIEILSDPAYMPFDQAGNLW